METRIIRVPENEYKRELLIDAAKALSEGKTVAFPTETVYGIGANGLDEAALNKIFKAKGRPSDNPLILHVTSLKMVEELVAEISPVAKKLMEAFWPGPLTIIFRKSVLVPEIVTAGLSTVAIRMPNHQLACDLIDMAGVPVAAPSANLSGKPSPTSGDHVVMDLSGRVDYIIVERDTDVGLESTVVDATGDTAVILRPGGLTKESIETVLGEVLIDPAIEGENEKVVPMSPGMKYTHYAPEAEVLIVKGEDQAKVNMIIDMTKRLKTAGKKVGIMTCDEHKALYQADVVFSLGTCNNMNQIGKNLFATLRAFDEYDVDIILAEAFTEEGIGHAVMNRLKKAAGNQVIEV